LLDYADDREDDYEKYEFVYDGTIIDDQKKKSKSTDNNNKGDVDVDETPMTLGMKQGDKILASHVDQIGLTIRLDEKEHGYLVDRTSMISKTFDVFAEDIEKPEKSPVSDDSDDEEEAPDTSGDAALAAALAAENNNNNSNNNASASSESEIGGNAAPEQTKRSQYIFLLQSQRLFGFETAITLGLKSSGSVIDAVHVEEHKHMNCICCYPPPASAVKDKHANAMEEEEKGSSDDDLSIDY